MKHAIISRFDKLIVALLGILGALTGFTSCMYGSPLVMYGPGPVPDYTAYSLQGTITDKVSGQPIKDIQVMYQSISEITWEGDTIYSNYANIVATNDSGKFVFEYVDERSYKLSIVDMDGEDNGGLYKTAEIKGNLKNAVQVEEGDGEHFLGKFVETQNAQLEKVIPDSLNNH